MSGKYRIGLVLFSLLGLGASIAALYVHYRLMVDPGYSSFCDVNATVSCEQVLESAYGRVFGVPVAAGGAIWSGLVLLLSWYGMRQPDTETARRSAGYVFVLATTGLAAVFYFAYTSFFVLRQACPICLTMYASVVAIFMLSAAAAGSLRDLPGRVASDIAGLRTSPTAATLAAAWLVASLGLGLLISVISDSERQAVQLSLLTLLASMFFSGFVLRTEEFSTPVQIMSYFLPVTHGISLLQDQMLTGVFAAPWQLVALGGIGAVLLATSWLLLRRELRPA